MVVFCKRISKIKEKIKKSYLLIFEKFVDE